MKLSWLRTRMWCFWIAMLGIATLAMRTFGSIYTNDMDYVIGDVKQAFIQDKISTEAQVDNLLLGFNEMALNGIRVPIFAAGLEPNKAMLDYFIEEAVAQGFLIFANPAQSSGGHRIALGILEGDLVSVNGDTNATATLINRIIDFAQEYPCTWINPFNEDGQPGQAWSADQMNAIYSALSTNLNGTELIGPGVWGIPGSIAVLENSDILDYVTVATTHNLGFNHSRWADFIALADARELPVWDSEVNHYDKYGTGTRLEKAIENQVDGLVLYNSWTTISLSDGSINNSARTIRSLYLKPHVPGVGEFDYAQNVGTPAWPGTASYTNGVYSIEGGGADIYGTEDHFYYLYGDHSADGEIAAQILSVEGTDVWAKGGVMFRESATAGAKEVAIVARPDKQVVMQYRASTDGPSVSLGLVGGTASVKWIKLERSSDLFTGSYSLDGESWMNIGSVTVGMSANILQGLAVTSHNNADLSTAVFNRVSPAPSALMATSIGADRIDLAWNPAVSATAYNLKRSTSSGGPYTLVDDPLASTNYSNTGLFAGTGYYYVVSAEYLGVEGDSSAEVFAVPSELINPEAVEIISGGIVDNGSGGRNLSFSIGHSFLGHNYWILSSDDLVSPDWQNVSDVFPGNGGELHMDVPMDSEKTNRFYRLETWRQ